MKKKKKIFFDADYDSAPWEHCLNKNLTRVFLKGGNLLDITIFAVLECKKYPAEIKNNEATFLENLRLVCEKFIIIITTIIVNVIIIVIMIISIFF